MTAPPPGPDSVWLLALACSPRCPRPGPAPAEPGLHTPARTAHAQTLHYWHPALQHSTLTHLWQNWDQGDNSPRPSGILGSPITPTSPTQCANIVCMSPGYWAPQWPVPLWWGTGEWVTAVRVISSHHWPPRHCCRPELCWMQDKVDLFLRLISNKFHHRILSLNSTNSTLGKQCGQSLPSNLWVWWLLSKRGIRSEQVF